MNVTRIDVDRREAAWGPRAERLLRDVAATGASGEDALAVDVAYLPGVTGAVARWQVTS